MLSGPSVASLVERLNANAEKAEGIVTVMNNGGKWRMRVPANLDDSDLIICELVNVAREAASRLAEERIHTSDKSLARVTPASPAATERRARAPLWRAAVKVRRNSPEMRQKQAT